LPPNGLSSPLNPADGKIRFKALEILPPEPSDLPESDLFFSTNSDFGELNFLGFKLGAKNAVFSFELVDTLIPFGLAIIGGFVLTGERGLWSRSENERFLFGFLPGNGGVDFGVRTGVWTTETGAGGGVGGGGVGSFISSSFFSGNSTFGFRLKPGLGPGFLRCLVTGSSSLGPT